MKKRQWSLRRSTIETPDAKLRWHRAYQGLVQWSATTRQEKLPELFGQESRDESRHVCPGVDPTSGLDAWARSKIGPLVRSTTEAQRAT